MADTSEAVRALYNRLEEVLGPEHAETLMTRLPSEPLPLASKSDVDLVRSDLDTLKSGVSAIRASLAYLESRFDRMEDRFDRVEDRFHDQVKTFMVTTVGAMTALTGVFGVIVSILR